ncbi:MAG: DUF427 domain-containing protein, partial [Pseudomonadota bacterium]
TYYIPVEDILMDALRSTEGSSFCEWKGRAAYFAVAANGKLRPSAAWTYPKPRPDFSGLIDHIAFYAHAMDACFVNGNRVTSQPGSFYGGWVTPNLQGLIKGAAGTEGW